MSIFTMLRRGAYTAILAATAAVSAEARELRVSVFEPPQGFYPVHIFTPWIEKLNAEMTGGTSLQMYPGAILGSPLAQRDLVASGAADVALVIPTYTPGVFPGTSVVEVPYIARNSLEGAKVLNSLLEEGLISDEYKDYKVIGLFGTPAYNVISNREGVRVPADISGYKMRIPSTFMNLMLTKLGATSINLPATQVYEGLERRVIDATMWNYNAATTFRLNEPAPYFTITKLGVTPVAILMNKSVYESLPEADRAVIDVNSGRSFSEWAGEVSDKYEEDMRQKMLSEGTAKEYIPTEAEAAEWQAAVADASKIWMTETTGMEPERGKTILERAKAVNQ